MNNEIYILGGARTAIGTFGGSLSGVSPIDLAASVSKEAIQRAEITAKDIGQVVFGHVINTEPKDMYLSRVAALKAGISDDTPAMNVNRLCGSGAQAIVSVFQSLMMEDAQFGLAGGAENMSRSPHIIPAARWGRKMGDTMVSDMMIGALTCPFGTGHMGVTAENVASELNITRREQDIFAFESQTKAKTAIEDGRFQEQIIPIQIKQRKGDITFSQDEHPKDTDLEQLSGLSTVFKKGGTVTAGNSSGINDGAAALVLGTHKAILKNRLNPIAKILGYAQTGVRPEVMGIGPITAVQKLCKKLHLEVNDFDIIESNEAFAAQACAVTKELHLDPQRVNPNGGAIALGHPVGATGAILVIKVISELKRTNTKLGLVTMCIGGGQGIAIALQMV
ncbi:MAG: acetyl-CoA C-acyltransferase [Rhodobacteraceae bacterium]|nr:MAG: acetyl-CoA C-acyltransferase [Paracoccaceae bacterium]